jgi:enamine deaminase RidA (YjgF/YER057c/UK114 family)
MPSQVEARLAAAGHAIPPSPKPAAAYIHWTQHGKLVFTAGQIPSRDGKPVATGLVGKDHTIEQAQKVAEVAALNVIAALKAAAEANGKTLDQVKVLKTTNFVASAPGFTDQHLVANGASQLFMLAFGSMHARSAVATPSLPLNVPFEVEAVAELL